MSWILDEILDLIESVSEGFPTYFSTVESNISYKKIKNIVLRPYTGLNTTLFSHIYGARCIVLYVYVQWDLIELG